MQPHKFTIIVDGGTFWERQVSAGLPYDDTARFSVYDELANGFMWTMKTKCGKQRKWRFWSARTKSVYGMLDAVKQQFAMNLNVQVVVLTPDVELTFVV